MFSMIRDTYFISTLGGCVIYPILLIQANTTTVLNNIMFG